MSESQGQSLTVVGKGELTPAVVVVAEVLAVVVVAEVLAVVAVAEVLAVGHSLLGDTYTPRHSLGTCGTCCTQHIRSGH